MSTPARPVEVAVRSVALGGATLVLAATSGALGYLSFWSGQWMRFCTSDCGDAGGRLLFLWWLAAALPIPLAAGLVRLGAPLLPSRRWARGALASVDLAVGATGWMWLFASLLVPPLLVAGLPIWLAAMALAGSLRRRCSAERRVRDLADDVVVPELLRRHLPYALMAIVLTVQLAVGLGFVGDGSACHSRHFGADWDACVADGPLGVAVVRIALLSVASALVVAIGSRLGRRSAVPAVGLVGFVGVVLVAATATSHGLS